MSPPHPFKQKLAGGRKCLGVWSGVLHTTISETLLSAGYDFIILDHEHGMAGPQETLPHLQMLDRSDCSPIVRVPWNDQVYFKRILDAGATTVMVPMVESAEEAKAVVAACRYPPKGARSFGPWRHIGLERDIDAWRAGSNDRLTIILQIESAKAVSNIAAIAAVDGVDALFIGPNDLSGTLGRLREYDHPEVKGAIEGAFAAIRRAGKPAGIVPYANKSIEQLLREGYSMVAGNTELTLLAAAARSEVTRVRAAIA